MSLGRSKLTLDIGPLLEDHWTGIPVFTRRLVRALTRHGGLDLEFAFNFVRFPPDRVLSAIRLGAGAYLREDFESRGSLDYDLVDPSAPLFYPSAKGAARRLAREASTVHDMSTLFMPENHEPANVAHHLDHLSAELASDEAVFCISQATRAALVTALPSVADKTRLIYQYVDWPEDFELMERNLAPPRLGRYAVVVGTLEPRKNLRLLIDALALPQVIRRNLNFVVIGKKGWLVDSFLEGLTAEQRKSLIFSGFVSEFVKYRLIKGAEFMVFPSLYEGFGIPALEAMSLGKPVLAARSSSLPEVIGDAGVYFDPLSISEFADALDEIADPLRIAELAPRAIERNAAFGPERMAAPVVDWANGRAP
jgi:glycosyltransferase involved in cell wall biosynthesis